MLKSPNYVFEEAAQEDLKDIARMHRRFFGCTFSGQLGLEFLEDFYSLIKASPEGVILVCKDKGKIAGFIAGLSSEGNFFLKLLFGNLGPVIWHWRQGLDFLRKEITFKDGEFKAELKSVAILEGYQRQGIASQLVSGLEEFFKRKNVSQYKVFTDLKSSPDAWKFYENSGFHLHQKENISGVETRLYTKTIVT